MKSRFRAIGIVTVGLLVSSYAVLAATPEIAAAIAARKANYREIGGAFKSINDEIRSGAPDIKTIRPLARDIAARSALQLKYFPRGSGPESGIRTRAKAEIWKDYATFSRFQKEMIAAANALNSTAVSGNVAALPAARAALAGTCKGCHERFRDDG